VYITAKFHANRSNSCMYVCMYVCMVIYVRATAYSLGCHVGAMINRRLYRTFQSLVVHRTAAVTSTGCEVVEIWRFFEFSFTILDFQKF